MSENIAFIGVGNMGNPMACNLKNAGKKVKVFDVSKEMIDKAVENNLDVEKDFGKLINSETSVVITMLPEGKHSKEVYLKENGVLDKVSKNCLLIDCSTIDIDTSKEIGKKANEKGIKMIDAPVSGGVKGAQNANLSIMVGGKKDIFKKSINILNCFGKNVIYAGKSGMGQIFKMCNQIMVGSHIQAMCEAFALCKSKGGNLNLLRETLMGGSANSWMLENLGNHVIDKNDQAGFRIDLQLKDLRLASEAAFESGVPLPGLSLVQTLYLESRAHNEGKNGNQSLFKTYDRMTNQK